MERTHVRCYKNMTMKKQWRKELAGLNKTKAKILAASERDYTRAEKLYERTMRQVGRLADRQLAKLERRIAILNGRLAS